MAWVYLLRGASGRHYIGWRFVAFPLAESGTGFYVRHMKKIFYFLMVVGLAAPLAVRAQDAVTEERLTKLAGEIEELQKADVQRRKDLADLSRQIEELRQGQGRVNTNYAAQEDLNRLADKLKEIDEKRVADNEKILKEIEKLGKVSATPEKKSKPVAVDNPVSGGGSDKGFEYVILPNDTLSAIVAEYRAKNIKVTVDSILKANPGLDEKKLKPGKKIFIPAPTP
jgi:LysM repeat protein